MFYVTPTPATAHTGCGLTPYQKINKEIESLPGSVISGYIQTIETKDDWLSYRSTGHALNSASLQEARFNRSGQSAYYLASGIETAQANVSGWETKAECRVEPQKLTCFDLGRFAKDHGHTDEFRVAKAAGGYALTQETADLLYRQYGVTGLLYTSATKDKGCCIVLRTPNNEMVSETFFRTGEAPPISGGKV